MADAHRIGHLDLPGGARSRPASRRGAAAAPRILLVDSGRWYYDSQIRYFEDALTSLDYPFDLWTIRDPFGLSDGTGDRPDCRDPGAVRHRHLVVAPGFPGADRGRRRPRRSYLAGGGRLLVSGQDIAYWDGGGSPFESAGHLLHLRLGPPVRAAKETWNNLAGVPGTPFAGLSVALNTPDSARQQQTPDAVAIERQARHPARPALA